MCLYTCMMMVFKEFQVEIICGGNLRVCIDIRDVSMEVS